MGSLPSMMAQSAPLTLADRLAEVPRWRIFLRLKLARQIEQGIHDFDAALDRTLGLRNGREPPGPRPRRHELAAEPS